MQQYEGDASHEQVSYEIDNSLENQNPEPHEANIVHKQEHPGFTYNKHSHIYKKIISGYGYKKPGKYQKIQKDKKECKTNEQIHGYKEPILAPNQKYPPQPTPTKTTEFSQPSTTWYGATTTAAQSHSPTTLAKSTQQPATTQYESPFLPRVRVPTPTPSSTTTVQSAAIASLESTTPALSKNESPPWRTKNPVASIRSMITSQTDPVRKPPYHMAIKMPMHLFMIQ